MIDYRDYLLNGCNNSYYNFVASINPDSFSRPVDFMFKYNIGFDMDEIYLQANTFSREISQKDALMRLLDERFFFSNESDQIKDDLANMYVYSFIKAAHVCRKLSTGNSKGIATYSPTYIFTGHKMLTDCCRARQMHYNDSLEGYRITLIKQLRLDSEQFKLIEKLDLYKSNFDSLFDVISNDRYERMLSCLSTSNSLSICEMGSRNLAKAPAFVPLGNMCFDIEDKNSDDIHDFLSVISNKALRDHVSKFWNIANFITLVEKPEMLDKYSFVPYFRSNIDQLTPLSIFSQVQSITGLNCGRKYSDFGTYISNDAGPGTEGGSPSGYGGGSPGGGNSPSGSSGGGNSPSGSNPSSGGGKGNKSKPSKPSSGKSNKPRKEDSTFMKKQEKDGLFKVVKEAVKSVGKQVNPEFMLNLAADLFNKHLSRRQAEQLQLEYMKTLKLGSTTTTKEVHMGVPLLNQKTSTTVHSIHDNGDASTYAAIG